MADYIRPINFLLTVSCLVLTAGLWSGMINGIVPEPYLVSLAPHPWTTAHAIRMRSSMSGKHKHTFEVNGTFGTPSLRLLLACGFHRMPHCYYYGLTMSKSYLASWLLTKPFLALGFRRGVTGILTKAPALRSTNFYGSIVLAWTIRSIVRLNVKVHNGECEGKHE